VDGLNRAGQAGAGADFLQRQVRVIPEEFADLAAVGVENDGLAAAAMVKRLDGADLAALAQKLFDHAEGDLEPTGNLIACDVAAIIGFEDALSKIQGKRGHEEKLSDPSWNAHTFI